MLKVDTIEQVYGKMDNYFQDLKLNIELINIEEAMGRTASEDIASEVNIPDFNRSTVDGYAIKAADTFGVNESIPAFLDLIGSVEMGNATDIIIKSGKAVYVPTGGMIPEGADGMIMIEYIEEMDDHTIAAYSPIAPGENIIKIGDDVLKGEKLISKGKVVRPQDIGTLAAAGVRQIKVFEKPRIAVISTGDEIVDPFGTKKLGQVRDINTYTLSAMAEELGAKVTVKQVIRDEYELLEKAVEAALVDNHIVLVSGGSSVGNKDVTAKVIAAMGEPGVFVHGIAIKPGKPTIVGKAKGKALFGLPGHPVSALIVFKVLIEHLIEKLMSRENQKLHLIAECASNVHSSPGKETFQMVELESTPDGYLAVPLHGKSGAISLVSRSRGFIRISNNKEGLSKGEIVKVELL